MDKLKEKLIKCIKSNKEQNYRNIILVLSYFKALEKLLDNISDVLIEIEPQTRKK